METEAEEERAIWWGRAGEKSMAVIGWIKEEGPLVVLKEAQYLDSGVDESFRLVGMRRAWAGKIRLYDRPPFLPWLLLPLLLNLDFGERRNRRRSVLLNLVSPESQVMKT